MARSTEAEAIYPRDSADKRRWEDARQILRLLEDEHARDVQQHMAGVLDPSRLEAWGAPSTGLNLMSGLVERLAVLYDDAPVVSHPDLTPEAAEWLKALDVFRYHRRHQQHVLALRESLVHLRWSPGIPGSAPPGLEVRLVTPDRVVVTASPTAPGVPVRIEEMVERYDPVRKRCAFFWDVWDITDPAHPYFRVEQDRGPELARKDVTARLLGGPVTWVWFDEHGNPFLPFVLAHAEAHGGLWDPRGWGPLVHATLEVCLQFTYWSHIGRNAAFVQKVGVDVQLQGATTAGAGASTSHRVATDPASIMMFRTTSDKPGSVTTLAQAADPIGAIDSIGIYIRMVLESFGIDGPDAEVKASASGVAIQIRRDALRRLQARYEVSARRSDLEIVRKAALVSNLFGDRAKPVLPTDDGWSISYPGLPFSREEEADRLAVWERRIALGIASRVDLLLAENPAMTREEALEVLARVRQENALTGPAGSV